MKLSEILRLVWINLIQNKFKVVLTSIGIVVGAATIVMVIAIGRGGQMDVQEQFKTLNAGAIDISYEQSDDLEEMIDQFRTANGKGMENFGGGAPSGGTMNMANGSGGKGGFDASGGQGGGNGGFGASGGQGGGNGQMPSDSGQGTKNAQSSGQEQGMGGMGRGMGEQNMILGGSTGDDSSRMNQENITLSEDDVDDLKTFLPGVSDITISYTTKSDVEGGELEEAASYTIAGVKSNYADMSNLTMAAGEFLSESEEEQKQKVCILGSTLAKEIFGSVEDAYDSTLYIDGRAYVVNGILNAIGSVSSGISPDEAVFIPYSTGVKYLVGTQVSPTITVIMEDVDEVDTAMENIQTILEDTYPNAEFTLSDAGSKMEAASASNDTLTALLISMAVIVFLVGGIGIMNVLFVSVKERTKEIGILKAIGCSKKDILLEFLLEACFISILGGILGVLVSFGITPVIERFNVRVELSVFGAALAVAFAVATGTVFGFYPAWKASRLVPVDALNEE
jgi:putative ABC transport system permease protein